MRNNRQLRIPKHNFEKEADRYGYQRSARKTLIQLEGIQGINLDRKLLKTISSGLYLKQNKCNLLKLGGIYVCIY